MTDISIPPIVRRVFAKFPLHTYLETPLLHKSTSTVERTSLWVAPPPPSGSYVRLLSGDVECLKWQAYIALRGLKGLRVRWDISPDGSIDGRLPSLQTADQKILGPRMIPAWVDDELQVQTDRFEGYRDAAARDESRAWVALLEGIIHAALTLYRLSSPSFKSILFRSPRLPFNSSSNPPLSTHLSPPTAPSSGLSSLLPIFGEHVSSSAIEAQYNVAISSLSDRLGDNEWFLGSAHPTALDALAFAYIHSLLNSPNSIRIPVARKLNLVAWERRVEALVNSAYIQA